MDFLFLGALDSIQGARRIGFHSLLGHAGHFLFSFFPRKECSLLADLLVGSMPKQETRLVPRMHSADWNGFVNPKHNNCFPRTRGRLFLELPAEGTWPRSLTWEWSCFHQGWLYNKTSSPNLGVHSDFPSLDSMEFFLYHFLPDTTSHSAFVTSFCGQILTKFSCHWNPSRKLAKMKHDYFPLTFFFLKRKQCFWQKIRRRPILPITLS